MGNTSQEKPQLYGRLRSSLGRLLQAASRPKQACWTGLKCLSLLSILACGSSCQASSAATETAASLPPPAKLSEQEAQHFYQKCLALPQAIGPYSCRFRLEHQPGPKAQKTGASKTICYGQLEARTDALGYPLLHLSLERGEQEPLVFIILGGPKGHARALTQTGEVPVDKDRPLLAPFLYTAQDWVMSFAYWPQCSYCFPTRYKGRPAQVFDLYDAQQGWRVRSIWDDRFFALLKAQWHATGDTQASREISILSYQKIPQGYWTIKTLECLNPQDQSRSTLEILYFAFQPE